MLMKESRPDVRNATAYSILIIEGRPERSTGWCKEPYSLFSIRSAGAYIIIKWQPVTHRVHLYAHIRIVSVDHYQDGFSIGRDAFVFGPVQVPYYITGNRPYTCIRTNKVAETGCHQRKP